MLFSARFDQDVQPFFAGESMCNIASVYGATPANELSASNNTDDACLLVPPCGPRQCMGEIYLTEKTENATPTSYIISGVCEVEGNCNMAGIVPTNEVSLTYETCT
jgi:hypothetical protein